MQLEIHLARPLPEDMSEWLDQPDNECWNEDHGAVVFQYETVEDDGEHICTALNNRDVAFIAHQYGTPNETGRRVTFAAFGRMTECDAIGADFRPAVPARYPNMMDAVRLWNHYASVHQVVYRILPA